MKMKKSKGKQIFFLSLFLFFSSIVIGQWSTDSQVNTSVCTKTGDQGSLVTAYSGYGSTIISWLDNDKIYAQKLNSMGEKQWDSQGILVFSNALTGPAIVSDDMGGAIISTQIPRLADPDQEILVVQRLNAQGIKQWQGKGTYVDSISGEFNWDEIQRVQLLTDKHHGTLVFYRHYYADIGNDGIRFARINKSGIVLWNKSIGYGIKGLFNFEISPYERGGAIYAYQTYYGTKLNAGFINLDGSYSDCVIFEHENSEPGRGFPIQAITNDGQGGGIIVWKFSERTGHDQYETKYYAQRINSACVPQWAINHVIIIPYNETFAVYGNVEMAPVSSGGAVLLWKEIEEGVVRKLHAQRLDNDGNLKWDDWIMSWDIFTVGQDAGEIHGISVLNNSKDEFIISYHGVDSTMNNLSYIAAKKLNVNGINYWGSIKGNMICDNPNSFPGNLSIVQDGFGGAVYSWVDQRNGNSDIYTQQINTDGQLGEAYTPKTIHVPAEYATIQEAINAANTGDRIIVAPGTYDISSAILNNSVNNLILVGSRPIEGGTDCIINAATNPGTYSALRFENVSGCTISGFEIKNAHTGITIDYCGNCVISSNYIHDNDEATSVHGNGISVFHCDGININHNIVDNNEFHALDIGYDSRNITVVNNTLLNTQRFDGIVLGGPSNDNVTIKNNIIAFHAEEGIEILGDVPNFVHDYNCFFQNGGTGNIKNLSIGANSFDADPQFVDASNFDYYLQLTSPCVGAGEFGDDIGALGTVEDSPLLFVSPTTLDFGAYATTLELTIENRGGGTFIWSATENPDETWITSIPIYPNFESPYPYQVTVNRSSLNPGSYSSTITITSNGGTQNVTVNITKEEIRTEPAIIFDFGVNEFSGGADVKRSSPKTAVSDNGDYVVCWQDTRNGNWDIFCQQYNYDSDVSPNGSNFKVNTDPGTNNQKNPAIDINNSGDFVICWQDSMNGNWDIYARRYNSNGTPQGSNFKVNDGVGNSDQTHPDMAVYENGNFIICWTDERNSNKDIYIQRYNSQGTPLGSNFKVQTDSDSKEFNPAIALNNNNGNFVICWMNQPAFAIHIFAQRYNSNGTPLGTNIPVYWTNLVGVSALDIAMDENENFVVCWDTRCYDSECSDDWGIRAKLFTNDGSVSEYLQLPNISSKNQIKPAVSYDISGKFVICWQDARNGSHDIYAQRFENNGQTINTDYRVNYMFTEKQNELPHVDCNNGRIHFVWAVQQNEQDNDIISRVESVAPQILAVSPTTLDFDDNIPSMPLFISNSGSGTLTWSLAENPDKPWITTINPTSGTGEATVTVAVDRSQLTSESDSGVLTVTSNGGNVNVDVFISKPQTAVPIYPVVSNTTQPVGSEFWVDIFVGSSDESVSDLFGVSFDLAFTNTDYIDVVTPQTNNAVPGDFIGSNVVFLATVDEANGKISFGISKKSGQGGVNGFGVVARIKFLSDASTPSNTDVVFSLSNIVANNSSLSPINLSPENLTVTLAGLIVWPGDTNNNNVVDQADILPLGFYWASTGPARPDAFMAWFGQSATPWTPENATYADANGDGKVNQADVLPIGFNWHKTHGLQAAIPSEIPFAEFVETNGTVLKINIGSVTTKSDSVCQVDIFAENVTNLFGISFEFGYSPKTNIDLIKVIEESWLGEDILFYPNVNQNLGIVSFGISKKAGQGGISGTGTVAKFYLKLNNLEQVETNLKLQNVIANDDLGNPIQFEVVNHVLTSVEWEKLRTLQSYLLMQNYPNPFNPETNISYQLPERVNVVVTVLNLRGQKIRTLQNSVQDAGYYNVRWNGCDEFGNKAVSGIYLYRIKAGDFVQAKKMSLLR
jgi:parallel beta-helix repeat protein